MSDKKCTTIRELYYEHKYEVEKSTVEPLWHYTSATGLIGIVRNEESEHGKLHFWFTRSDCLNDTSEGEHTRKVYKEVCEALYNESAIDEKFYNLIKDITISAHAFVSFPIPSHEGFASESVLDCVPCDAYICCFSLKEDSLDMWRYYSKSDGGYALKIRPFVFEKLFKYEYSSYSKEAVFSCMKAYKVIYKKEEQERILKKLVVDSFSVYRHLKNEEDIVKFIKYILKQLQFQFKHECYESEQEYRFVYYHPYSKPKLLENKILDVQYRTQNGIVVPYLDIEIDKSNAYIEEVLISPFIKNSCVLATTNEYLSQCGFNCTTRLSQLPVR